MILKALGLLRLMMFRNRQQNRRFKTNRSLLFYLAISLSTAISAQALAGQQDGNIQIVPRDEVDEQKLSANGIRTIGGKHLAIHTDVRERPDIDELASVFDQAVPQWCRYFGVDESAIEPWKLGASVILDPPRFERAGLFPADLPKFLAGYQRGSQIWLYVQQGDYYTRHLLLHEGTHAFMNQFLGGLGAPWYSEGMAELIGLNEWRDSKLTIAHGVTHRDEVPYWGRVALIRKAVEKGELKSLEEVFQIPGSAFRQVESYAWAWAACEFLSRHPLSEKLFSDLSSHCADDPEKFNRRLTDALQAAWPELEFQWRQFLIEIDYGYDVARAAISPAQANVEKPSTEFLIAADRGWQATGIQIVKGKSLTITASGEFQIAKDTEPWPCQPNGVTLEYYRGLPLGRLIAAILPAPSTDNSTGEFVVIDVGNQATIIPNLDGLLLLRLNESPAHWRDNVGAIRVDIR